MKAVQTNKDDHPTIASLHSATYGMLMFGTPQKGILLDDIQQMISKNGIHLRSGLFDLNRTFDLLANQLVDFKDLIRDRKVMSFYERRQTRRLEPV